MPIKGVEQPAILPVEEGLRLHRYEGECDFALNWYQDPDTLLLVDGKTDPYTPERLRQMYEYLNQKDELYFIEVLEQNVWRPVGDVTFWQQDMPIVVGEKSMRGHGIGTKVVKRLVQRGRELGYAELFVEEIYTWNSASRRCFEKAGFLPFAPTEKGCSYRLVLK